MDTNERRKLLRKVGQMLDYAETIPFESRQISKVEGTGWLAWIYRPNGPGSDTIHVELRVGASWPEERKLAV